ncbi:MAG: xanthine dehydrogenase family protein molybdopterin-binding subunit [Acidimicrobiales bacterium]|nr:xanthine dehydrogenase family protein molybdopterin-binding subunit [Acidimicrobiales bacterium]
MTDLRDVEGSLLGNAVLRKEDPSLLDGSDKYFDDIDVPGVGYVHFLRSPFAHATLGPIDTSYAEAEPGVRGVWTADTLEMKPFLGFAMFDPAFSRPPLAKGKVRFVGDIVAVVVADTRAQAIDASEQIDVEYDPLDAVIDQEAAMADGAPLLFEEHGSNIVYLTDNGVEDDPVADAERIVEARVHSQRLAGVPMEPNGCLVVPGEGDQLTVWIPSQNAIAVRDAIVGQLDLNAEKVRVAAPVVGGGFGSKAGAYTEFLITTKLAQVLGQPLKWTEQRSENMVAMAQGRDMVLTARLGVRSDGTITGLDFGAIAATGAYPAVGGFLTYFTQMMCQGVYNIPALRFRATSVATNNTQIAAYRGAGRPEATQLLERVIDLAAAELGIDPVEMRRKNFLTPDVFPYATHGGTNYDNGDYAHALQKALDEFGYEERRAEQAARRASGDPKQLGIGICSYVEITAPTGLHVEYGRVEVNEDGTATAKVGTSSHGQGHDTAFSMLVSEVLGIPMDKVILHQSDTDLVPKGAGTMGSRSLQAGGSAVYVASQEVFDKAKKLAAHMLEAAEADIVKGEGGLQVAGVPASAVSWGDLAAAAKDPAKLPEGMEPGLSFEHDFDGQDATFPFGTHISLVEVDVETGATTMLRHVAVDDCGRILNPLLVTGQQHGGIAQGIAQALFEEVAYDEDGNPITSNLMDYAIPSAAELISFDTFNTETPTFRNPLGAKGIGESGTIGSTSAIHNAVIDAVSHLGVKHIDMPLSARRVWQAVQAAAGKG